MYRELDQQKQNNWSCFLYLSQTSVNITVQHIRTHWSVPCTFPSCRWCEWAASLWQYLIMSLSWGISSSNSVRLAIACFLTDRAGSIVRSWITFKFCRCQKHETLFFNGLSIRLHIIVLLANYYRVPTFFLFRNSLTFPFFFYIFPRLFSHKL